MVIHGEVVGEDRLRWSLEYRAIVKGRPVCDGEVVVVVV